VLLGEATVPTLLVGHSWGAWLGYLLAARRPELVSKLILVSSGAFEAEYAAGLMDTRISRLSAAQREELGELLEVMNDAQLSSCERDSVLERFGALTAVADTYERARDSSKKVDLTCDMELYESVWPEAAALRESGELLAEGESIECPVLAIHGSYDSTPAEGVEQPLSAVLEDFRFVLLEKCGHTPWIEEHARERFYEVLKEEVNRDLSERD
jgi:pimeloyl-ACP methyl ester carboxylesterase